MHTVFVILIAVLMFGFMIFFHELGHFTMAKLSGIRVNEFAVGFGPKLLSRQKGETSYALRALPLGGFVRMEGEDEDSNTVGAMNRAPVSNRIAVILAGGTMNLILGFLILSFLAGGQEALASNTVSYFQEGAVTQASGLEIGDEIIAINGRRVLITDDIVYEMERVQTDGIADVTVKRNGKKITLPVQFDIRTDEATGAQSVIYDFKVAPIAPTLGNVIVYAGKWTVYIARLIFRALIDLVTGRAALNNLSGPVGIVTEIREAAGYGLDTLFYLFAIITINLGIFNLLPLPALDGGRFLFLLFEAVTRRRINPKYEAIVHLVGIILLLTLMVFVTYNDISRLI